MIPLRRMLLGVSILVPLLASSAWFYRSSLWHLFDTRAIDKRGFVPRVFIDDDGTEHRYVVFVPHIHSPNGSNGYPVLLFLNGVGENGEDGLLQVSNNFGRPIWEMQREFPFLAVAPQCSKNSDWSREPDASIALKVVDAVLADYPCDVNRVYVTGVSSGGAGVLHLVQHHVARFAAAVPISATANGSEEVVSVIRETGMPIWSFYNGGDKDHVVELNRSLHASMQAAGCDYRVTEYSRPGHNAWDYAYRDPALYRWLLSKTRSDQRTGQTFHPLKFTTEQVAEKGAPAENRRGPSGASHFRTLTHTPIQFRFNDLQESEIVFEAWLAEPIDIVLNTKAEEEQIVFCMARPDRIVGSAERLLGVTELVGQFAIRSGKWNTISIRRNGKFVEASVNGWTVWQSPPEMPGVSQLTIQPRKSSDDQSAPSIRNVRYRGKISRSIEVDFNTDSVAASQAHEDVTLQRSADFPREQLGKRSKAATGRSLSWNVQPSLGITAVYEVDSFRSRADFLDGQATFMSQRVDNDPTRMNLCVTKHEGHQVVQFRPSMLRSHHAPADFSTAIAMGFKLDQPPAQVHKIFRRMISSSESIDWLEGGEKWFSKAVRRRGLLDDSYSWARLTPDVEPEDQLDTLHQVAAMLSVGRIDGEPFMVERKNVKCLSDIDYVDGYPCHLFDEIYPHNDRFRRRFWIDREGGGLIRRYYGKVPAPDESAEFEYGLPLPPMRGDVCIELDYDAVTKEPVGWTIVNGQSDESPLTSVASAKVIETTVTGPDSIDENLSFVHATESWVIDEINQQQFVSRLSSERQVRSIRDVVSMASLDRQVVSFASESGRGTDGLGRVRYGLGMAGLVVMCLGVVMWNRRCGGRHPVERNEEGTPLTRA